ncbi:hypothetical protein LF1_57730 [Rubripirellula obstinata]|uniref:Uncharacterized protein n=1 Tax=Rubripirellula obstinata TaxID=406547 RepID=A0A5B1CBB3_9BACT|nr:hypothetical protein LF1_57730 [Rubripirellula obstinata]
MTEVLQSLCVLELVGRNIDESRVQQVRFLVVPRRAALERVRQKWRESEPSTNDSAPRSDNVRVLRAAD